MKDNDKYEEILNVALSLFSTKGYLKTSMMDIADAVGLTKGGIYHYISKKEDTLVMIHNRMANAFIEAFKTAADSKDNPQAKLESWLTVHAHLIEEYKPHVKVFFTELENLRNSEHYETIVKMRDEIFEMLYTIIEKGRKEKCFRQDANPLVIAFLVMGMMNWLYQWYRPGGSIKIEDIIENAQGLILKGILRD